MTPILSRNRVSGKPGAVHYPLAARSHMATTWIPGNIFQDCPVDWWGHMECLIEYKPTQGPFSPPAPDPQSFPMTAMVGGGGWVVKQNQDGSWPAPHGGHWNSFGVGVPLYDYDAVVPRDYWASGYSIRFTKTSGTPVA